MQIVTKENPKKKNINIIFRCGEQKHLIAMLEKGQIHFGIIEDWINRKVLNSDDLEGAFRFVDTKVDIKKKYDLFPSKGVIFARNKKVNHTFGFCVYGAGDDDYQKCKEINDDGELYRCCYLERAYLEPYKTISTVNEYIKNESENKMKLIYITHPEIFIKEIEKELIKFGFGENEIFYGPIVYVDKFKSESFDIFPASLFYKHIDYIKENEIRILIASERKDVVDKFISNGCNVEIGNIERYAKVIDYPYEDIQIKKEGGHIIFDTPNRFFLTNRVKSITELCKIVIKYSKKGVWINKRQHDEFEIVKKILWERDGVLVNISFKEDGRFETQFTNANPSIKDEEFQKMLSKIWSEVS